MSDPTLSIKYLIVHELIKTPHQKEALIELSKTCLPIDSRSKHLIEQLNNRYNKGIIQYARFEEGEGRIFPEEYGKYHADPNEETFLDLSQNTLRNLRDQVQNIPLAKGGYLVFSDYSQDETRFFGIFLIRNTTGLLFKRHAEVYTINPVTHLDLEKIAMACRIGQDTYGKQREHYLSFIKNNLPEVSQYFLNWIAAAEVTDNKQFTRTLMQLINTASLPKDEQGLEVSRHDLNHKARKLLQTTPNSEINIQVVGTHLFGDEDAIPKLAAENQQTPPPYSRSTSPLLKKNYLA